MTAAKPPHPRRTLPWRRWALAWHRDVGLAFSALVVAYSLSGLALNHAKDWDPDFLLHTEELPLPAELRALPVGPALYGGLNRLVGEARHRVADQPTNSRVKLYYEAATLSVDLQTGVALLERVERRPLFFQANVLHRNSLDGWRWIADVFAVGLITLALTGMVIPGGKYGLGGRGKWYVLGGLVPPLVAVVLFG